MDLNNKGMQYLDGFEIEADPITMDNAGINLLQEMASAFASSDWVTLSDVTEYELIPLMTNIDEWLVVLNDTLDKEGLE